MNKQGLLTCGRCLCKTLSDRPAQLWSYRPAARNISASYVLRFRKKQNHYETLEVDLNASSEQIRESFIKLSKQVHPDTNPDDPDNHKKFIKLSEAYNTLSKTLSRREYDLTLAHRMYYDDNLKRHGYGSHTSGGSYSPGSGTARDQGYDGHQGAFWDETIWYMRDKSRDKDAFYSEDSYYGIKGVKKASNSSIIWICCGIMALGSVSFWLCFRYSYNKSKQYIELQEKKNLAGYNMARENALKYSTAEQVNRIFGEDHKRKKKRKTLEVEEAK